MGKKTNWEQTSINERIKHLSEVYSNGVMKSFAQKTMVSTSTLSDIVGKKQNSPSFDTLQNLTKTLQDVSTDWLINGEGEMKRVEVKKLHNPPYVDAISDSLIPLFDIDAAANLQTLFENKRQNVIDVISIPDMPICDGAIRIRGDSMYPLLKSGDIVAYKEVHDKESIIFGEMYLVDFTLNGDYHLVVKYVKRSEEEGKIKLVSYNTHHEPMDIPLEGIRAMALVKASIRYNTMI